VRILGLEVRRSTKQLAVVTQERQLSPADTRGWYRIFESFAGAWQQNVVVDRDTVLSYSTVFACVTLIAQDIGKLRIKLVEQQPNGRWIEITSPAFSPLLRKPNHFQNRVKFIEYWLVSKLLHGNAYALKVRDNRGVVIALYLLDPTRVVPLVSDGDGSVFYQLRRDPLSKLEDDVVVPAREMIHDPMVTLFHPLVGVTPIYACGLAAMQGVNIQRNSNKFFANQSQPGGILTAPGSISDATAVRLKEHWENNFTGDNAGKVAVVGDGLKYERLTVNAVDAQMIEQLKLSAETVCSVFHVPPYMVGVGPMPAYNNIEALNLQYYAQCLQSLIESFEISLDEGLNLTTPTQPWGTEFDLDGLLRMDTATRYKSHSDGISGGWLAPNEARLKEDYAPLEGGNTAYMQQQNYALSALARRDNKEEETGGVDVQAQAMNGAQVTSLQAMLIAVTAGDLPVDTARAAIMAAFPLLTEAQVDAMIEPLETFTPPPDPDAPPPPPPEEDPPPPSEDDEEDMEDDEDEVRALLEYVVRGITTLDLAA
jgi:HK97 family phage portal protein